MSLLFNTITASPSGGGVRSFNDSNNCTKAGSNIIAGNSGYDLSADVTTRRYLSLGHNLIGVAGTNVDFSQEFNQTGDQVNVADPKLGPLADNTLPGTGGSPTQTLALLPDSPAIDAGDNGTCAAAPVNNMDQRGNPRPVDSDANGSAICDIGAFEYQRTITTTTLRSQKKYDGWILESGEYTKKGGNKNATGKILQVGDDAGDKQYRTILSFGTTAIPDNAIITKVFLKVKRQGVAGTNPMKTHNGLVVDIKKNKFYTMPALQIQDFQAKANKVKAGRFPNKLYSGWYRSALYKGPYPFINVKGGTQLRLRFLLDDNNDNDTDILKLYSGNSIKTNRPKLIVAYYVP